MLMTLQDPRLDRFQTLLLEHRSASHALFPTLIELAERGSLTADGYRVFVANLAARTMLTLPEIHASCVQASLDLDRVRTAFGVMTGAEEGGSGKPNAVHTVLMMNALNGHGRVVFGLPPIDLARLMAAVRLAYAVNQLESFVSAVGDPDGAAGQRLRQSAIFDYPGTLRLAGQLSGRCGYSMTQPSVREDLRRLGEISTRVLGEYAIVPETIDYCDRQLSVLTDPRPGYLQGVGFAHEGLADGMIFRIFLIVYAGLHHYGSENEFMDLVYPYFRAHGDYLAIVRGGLARDDGVEAVHARREFAKLAELDDESLSAAWEGANEFADRNARVWDGILNCVTQLRVPGA